MKNKFNLTREQNIFLAKKQIYEIIYNAVKLEGCNTTFLQTEKILNGINDVSIPLNDIQIILNLKSAWQYIIGNIYYDLNLNFICEVNKRVSKNESLDWGILRYGEVGVRLVDGSHYIPLIPNIDIVNQELNKILSIENATQRAIEYYVWGMKSQLFWDGNKRTSNLIANFILIKSGCGIITIDENNLDEFSIKLSAFYKDNSSELKAFLYEKCIKGLKI